MSKHSLDIPPCYPPYSLPPGLGLRGTEVETSCHEEPLSPKRFPFCHSQEEQLYLRFYPCQSRAFQPGSKLLRLERNSKQRIP